MLSHRVRYAPALIPKSESHENAIRIPHEQPNQSTSGVTMQFVLIDSVIFNDRPSSKQSLEPPKWWTATLPFNIFSPSNLQSFLYYDPLLLR